MAASFKIWEWRLRNLLECCCLPSPSPHESQNDVVLIQPKLVTPSSPPIPPKISDFKSDVEKELIHLRSVEREKPRPTIVGIDPKSRAHCIYGLIDAAESLDCAPSTLHLAANYLDRYLSTKIELREPENLRLVGLTCLMIASKYDGVTNKFKSDAYLSLFCKSNNKSKSNVSRDLIRMERRLLSHYLRYEVGPPTTWSFLERFVAVAADEGDPSELECVASYFAEVSLLSSEILCFMPSLVAAASVFLGRYVLEGSEKAWSGALRRCTMYRPSELRECVVALHEYCCCESNGYYLLAMLIKYGRNKYDECAALTGSFSPSIPPSIFQD